MITDMRALLIGEDGGLSFSLPIPFKPGDDLPKVIKHNDLYYQYGNLTNHGLHVNYFFVEIYEIKG